MNKEMVVGGVLRVDPPPYSTIEVDVEEEEAGGVAIVEGITEVGHDQMSTLL